MRRQRIELIARHLATHCAGLPPDFWLQLRSAGACPVNTQMIVKGEFYNVEIDVGFFGILPQTPQGQNSPPTPRQRAATTGVIRLSVAVDDAREPFASMPIAASVDIPPARDEAYSAGSFMSAISSAHCALGSFAADTAAPIVSDGDDD